MTKGLFVKEPWASLLLSGEKVWEIRSSATQYRGPLLIIKSGTGMAYGLITLSDCLEVPVKEFPLHRDKHKVVDEISYKKPHAWVMQDPLIFDKPVPIERKKGCVIFINLDDPKLDALVEQYQNKTP